MVALEDALSRLVHVHALAAALVDVVLVQGGVAEGVDLEAGEGVLVHLVLLEQAQALVAHYDASVAALVDVVAAKVGVAGGLHLDAGQRVVVHVVAVELAEAAVGDEDAAVIAASVDLVLLHGGVALGGDRHASQRIQHLLSQCSK